MNTYDGMEGEIHAFLTSALDGYEWSASRPAALPPGKDPSSPPPHPQDRRVARPQSQSGGGGEEKKIPVPAGNRTPVVQPVA
jgi:hypothetical protein